MFILYTTKDGKSQIQLRAKGETVWLTQREMALLFDVSSDNVGLHLKNIYEDGELSREATTEESSVVQMEGAREVQRAVTLFSLDAILAVGYRVRSPRGVQFRRWASTVLKEFLLKGFVLDDERLKNPDGRPDHFDEMLERFRDPGVLRTREWVPTDGAVKTSRMMFTTFTCSPTRRRPRPPNPSSVAKVRWANLTLTIHTDSWGHALMWRGSPSNYRAVCRVTMGT